MTQTLEWFQSRIGKTIYRNDIDCDCKTCRQIGEVGLEVQDQAHAEYLYDIQTEYRAEGINLNYRDEP